MSKIAIITGASSGIGAATAIALAERGVDSILTFNNHEDRVLDVVAAVKERGAKAIPLRLDVSVSASFLTFRDEVIALLVQEWKATAFDYLVNNAGFLQMASFEDTTVELFESYQRVLLKGPFFLTQALLPVLSDGGAIVNVTSNSVYQSGMGPGGSAYASMKGGLTTLTRYMAMEFGGRGIRVNAVAPGATRTRIADDAYDKYPQAIQRIVDNTALGRLGEANDVGATIAAVLSDDFRWVTGQSIESSGGAKLAITN
ncbi:SDR family NAD(P)-dependent oxidoreductase [Pseudomonas sp. NA-150]|uniref:SDR family NAD(P)-dependent oxidoreductase n=1 Tax=Pseudomonas sp. NA-150 TaxID=3367525 RepID=UPI0037C9B661